MNAERDCRDYLRDILEFAEKAERFVAGIDFQAFRVTNPFKSYPPKSHKVVSRATHPR